MLGLHRSGSAARPRPVRAGARTLALVAPRAIAARASAASSVVPMMAAAAAVAAASLIVAECNGLLLWRLLPAWHEARTEVLLVLATVLWLARALPAARRPSDLRWCAVRRLGAACRRARTVSRTQAWCWCLVSTVALSTGPVLADPSVPDDRDRSAVTHTRERGSIDSRLGVSPREQAPGSGEGGAAAAPCDRQCLQDLVDAYLKALIAHDPKSVPLSDHTRFTETGQELSLGDGFWHTVSGGGGFRQYFPDPQSEQIGFLGTLREFDSTVLMALRLRVVNRKISDIETLFYRRGSGPAWADAGVEHLDAHGTGDPLWLQPIPQAQRATREQLIAVAMGYLAALEHYDPKASYPVSDDCVRTENGARVTHNAGIRIGGPGFNLAVLGCRLQLQSGYFSSITRVHHARVTAADPDYGVVLLWANFDEAGTKSLTLANGRVMATPSLAQPAGSEVVLALRIENGLIRRIEMLSAKVPYHMGPGWEDIAPAAH